MWRSSTSAITSDSIIFPIVKVTLPKSLIKSYIKACDNEKHSQDVYQSVYYQAVNETWPIAQTKIRGSASTELLAVWHKNCKMSSLNIKILIERSESSKLEFPFCIVSARKITEQNIILNI